MLSATLTYERQSHSLIKELLCQKQTTVKAYVVSDSMSPFIKARDIIVIRPVTPKELRLGDIVVFDKEGRLFSHRLIRKYFKANRHIFITKSDRTFVADMPFTDKKLMGKVSRVQKSVKTLNLESIFWTLINRFLGLYHLTMFSVRNRLRPLKSYLFKKTSRCRL